MKLLERVFGRKREQEPQCDSCITFEQPHCDASILHAPKVCEYCDTFPLMQNERLLNGIPFDPANVMRWSHIIEEEEL